MFPKGDTFVTLDKKETQEVCYEFCVDILHYAFITEGHVKRYDLAIASEQAGIDANARVPCLLVFKVPIKKS